MKKVVPVFLMITSVCGLLCSVVGLMLALLSFLNVAMIIFAVPFLVVACIINAFPIVGGVVFIDKLCKGAMIVSIVSYAITLIGFILLLSR